MRRRMRAFAAGALAAGLLALPVRAEETEDTRALMREIFAAFATLVQHADDPAGFASLAEREEIVRSLQALERNATRLEAHTGSLSAAHRPVGRSLTDDVRRALDQFVIGHYESARFLSGQLVENCFACHSKLPSGQGFELGAELLEAEAVASLPPERRALLAVSARQFDTALALHEAYMADRHHSAVEISLSGAFQSYLKVALRVVDDRDRALATLASFRERTDLPLYLEAEIDGWVETLRTVDAGAGPGRLLERARDQIDAGRLRTSYPGDRRGLVNFVLASRWLHQHLAGPSLGRDERAETLLWLGLCEVHISTSLWVSEAEWFLDSAIRAAPETEHARTAYATLEGVYLEGYSGSAGTHLPPEIERRLASLRELVEAAPQPAGGSSR